MTEPDQNLEYALIDDEPLIRRVWEIAARERGVRLRTFATGAEALSAELPLETRMCVDLQLANGESGVDLTRQLSERGHRRIFLTTGMPPSFVPKPDWVEGVLGKDPPWLTY